MKAEEAERLRELVGHLGGQRLLVLGDMVADQYIIGRPSRISREAPVIILEHQREFVLPGGATNPAHNASTLGARVSVAGVIGDDDPGRRLRQKLEEVGIDTAGLIVQPGRPTYTKTRIIAAGTQEMPQQVARVDRFGRNDLDPECIARVVDYATALIPEVDALLLSDYENGVINGEIIEACVPLACRLGKIVGVDSHGDLFRFQGVTVATPNQPEAEATLHKEFGSLEQLEHGGMELLRGMQAQGVLITRGSEGMSLFEADGSIAHIPVSNLTEVRDVSGAGDTVAATVVLALAAGATMLDAALLGNYAAGLVVRRLGAATTTLEELAAAIAGDLKPAWHASPDPGAEG